MAKRPAPGPEVEPLENGDRLTASAFLRRYEAMPEVKKAELIEGVVYMGSPVRLAQHAEPDTLVQGWLLTYAARTPGTSAAGNATVRLDGDNVAQPDALLRLLPECGGRSRVNAQGYLEGPPELIVEIAASSATIDLHDKLRVYRRLGVLEYLVWRASEKQFDWLLLDEEEYHPNPADDLGIVHSRTFPGLCLDVAAALAMNAAKVLDVLQAAIGQSVHASFVADVAQRAKP